MSDYYFGQGKVYVSATENPLNPEGLIALGNAPAFSVTLGNAALRYADAGTAQPLKMLPSGGPPTFDLTLESAVKENLEMILLGQSTAMNGGTVVNESVRVFKNLSTGLRHINVTNFISLRNAANTASFIRDVDYVVDIRFGSIFIPPGSAIADNTQVLANYTYGSHTKVSAATTAKPKRWMRFEGVNLADNDSPVVVDIFKVRLNPLDSMDLIGDNFSTVNLTGRIFRDTAQPDNTTDGQFMRIRKL